MTSTFLPPALVPFCAMPQLDRGVDLAAGGGLLAGHRQDEADLHGVALRVRPRQHGQPASRRPQASRWRFDLFMRMSPTVWAGARRLWSSAGAAARVG